MSSIRDREREREKMEKDRDKERPGKERDNSPTNKRVKGGDRTHHPLRDNGSDPKAKSGGGDDRGRDDERRGSEEGKNKREDRPKGYDRTKSGDDLRGERKEERSKPSNGAKGGVDERSRYNSVGKSWKEKGEKEDSDSSGFRAIPTRGGDVISAPAMPSAGSSKYDPEKRRSMVAAELPSSVKRDLAAGSKTETALERIVKDINTQKHARPGSAHYVSTGTGTSTNNFVSDANDMKLREVSANEPTTGEDENSRRLVWRKNHSGGAPPVGGSLIVRPSDPINREPYAKEWRKSREVAQSSMARDMTARETTTTTAAREPPIPGIGGPAMPSSVKPGAKYDLLAPMRESIALRAKAEGELASQQKILAEVRHDPQLKRSRSSACSRCIVPHHP
jgi:hypothetical protein